MMRGFHGDCGRWMRGSSDAPCPSARSRRRRRVRLYCRKRRTAAFVLGVRTSSKMVSG
jgi:hypothetical protein